MNNVCQKGYKNFVFLRNGIISDIAWIFVIFYLDIYEIIMFHFLEDGSKYVLKFSSVIHIVCTYMACMYTFVRPSVLNSVMCDLIVLASIIRESKKKCVLFWNTESSMGENDFWYLREKWNIENLRCHKVVAVMSHEFGLLLLCLVCSEIPGVFSSMNL